MKHRYNTGWCSQDNAITNFLNNRKNIEDMHNSKIKVIKMFKSPLCMYWKVEYVLEEE